MKAKVSRDYADYYIERTNELFYDNDVFEQPFDVLGDSMQGGVSHCYSVKDCNGYIHRTVPVEFVTIIEE